MRVFDSRFKPGAKVPMHWHPAHLVYALSDYKMKHTLPDAAPVERELKTGQAIWSESVTHMAENTGTTETHSLVIELKEQAKSAEKKKDNNG